MYQVLSFFNQITRMRVREIKKKFSLRNEQKITMNSENKMKKKRVCMRLFIVNTQRVYRWNIAYRI